MTSVSAESHSRGVERSKGAELMLTQVDKQAGPLHELALLPQDSRHGGRQDGSQGSQSAYPLASFPVSLLV